MAGTVFEITDPELAAADEYEQRAKYLRIDRDARLGQAGLGVRGWIPSRFATPCSRMFQPLPTLSRSLVIRPPQPSWSPV